MTKIQTTDFLMIGGGVLGLTLALEIKRRRPSSQITLIEKEDQIAFHASGRNSGVLHAGFYYTADSLKARFTREGCKRWKQYCKDKNLKINECGKLVVAKNVSELDGLVELLRRAKLNHVELHEISESEAKKIEPRVKTHQRALYSPTTASVDPKEVMNAVFQDAKTAGVQILTSTAYLSKTKEGVLTSQGEIKANYIINAAGLYADKIAQDFGFSTNYRILPFKGLYLYSDETPGSIKTNIYPVPDLNNPFLGVHYTITAQGKIKIGPTAIPALWREHYQGFENFNWEEFTEVVGREADLFLRNSFGFRNLAFQEIPKYFRSRMVTLASELLTGVEKKNYKKWGPPGIRAQLLNIKTRKLEMDFKFEGDKHSFHVLNAVSPAFTCAMPFSEYLFDQMEKLTHGSTPH